MKNHPKPTKEQMAEIDWLGLIKSNLEDIIEDIGNSQDPLLLGIKINTEEALMRLPHLLAHREAQARKEQHEADMEAVRKEENRRKEYYRKLPFDDDEFCRGECAGYTIALSAPTPEQMEAAEKAFFTDEDGDVCSSFHHVAALLARREAQARKEQHEADVAALKSVHVPSKEARIKDTKMELTGIGADIFRKNALSALAEVNPDKPKDV